MVIDARACSKFTNFAIASLNASAYGKSLPVLE